MSEDLAQPVRVVPCRHRTLRRMKLACSLSSHLSLEKRAAAARADEAGRSLYNKEGCDDLTGPATIEKFIATGSALSKSWRCAIGHAVAPVGFCRRLL